MKKVVRLIAIIALGIAAAVIGLRFVGFEIAKYPPERPPNIPENTEWVGGRDGGVWIKCDEVAGSDPQQFQCDIYGENGTHWISGGLFRSFKVTWDGNSRSPVYEDTRLNALDYNAWDGRQIQLRNGYALKLLK